MAKVLVIDNYDSFTYNLVQYLGRAGEEVVVRRNDEIGLAKIEAMAPDAIMLSPGPCTPRESGVCLDVARAALNGQSEALKVPIFGVCLGHEALGEVSGGRIRQARTMRHGKASPIRHDGKGLFTGMPNPFSAIRYHSLVVDDASLPHGFIVTATSEDDHEIMGIRHERLPIEGVQFHPESALTEQGEKIIENFLAMIPAHARLARA